MAQILGTGSQRAAKTSRVTVQGVVLAFASWEANIEGESFDTTNFTSYNLVDGNLPNTFDEGILGKIMCGGSFGGDWDAGENPLDTTPGLYPRDDLPAVLLFESTIDNTFWDFPYVRIINSNNSGDIGGKVLFKSTYKNQGPFLYPTASV